jgi:hypothetical protein
MNPRDFLGLSRLSRIYAVGNGLALTLTLSPRRGKQVWPRWDESLISERRAVLESVSLSPGERDGVRASVLSTELFRLSSRLLSMNRRIIRQVLDCGDEIREVTALAVAALKIPKRPADRATPTQSGDSEDSVAAVQDARALVCFALGSSSACG